MQFLSTTWSDGRPLAGSSSLVSAGSAQRVGRDLHGRPLPLRRACRARRRPHCRPLYNRRETYVEEVLAKTEAYGLGADPGSAPALVTGSRESVVAAALTQLGVPTSGVAPRPAPTSTVPGWSSGRTPRSVSRCPARPSIRSTWASLSASTTYAPVTLSSPAASATAARSISATSPSTPAGGQVRRRASHRRIVSLLPLRRTFRRSEGCCNNRMATASQGGG